jgi:hypothetical protein
MRPMKCACGVDLSRGDHNECPNEWQRATWRTDLACIRTPSAVTAEDLHDDGHPQSWPKGSFIHWLRRRGSLLLQPPYYLCTCWTPPLVAGSKRSTDRER